MLLTWIEAHAIRAALSERRRPREARRLATDAIQEWFDAMEPEATRLYHETTERFVRAANEHIARVAADAADLEIDEMPTEVGFHLRRQFYFTHLMHTTGGTPITWLIDRLAPRSLRQTQVARAAKAYLEHLLVSNSHRVENDFRDRTRESRRWLEAQIRMRLAGTLNTTERALTLAREKQQMSEADVTATLRHLEELRSEMAPIVDPAGGLADTR